MCPWCNCYGHPLSTHASQSALATWGCNQVVWRIFFSSISPCLAFIITPSRCQADHNSYLSYVPWNSCLNKLNFQRFWQEYFCGVQPSGIRPQIKAIFEPGSRKASKLWLCIWKLSKTCFLSPVVACENVCSPLPGQHNQSQRDSVILSAENSMLELTWAQTDSESSVPGLVWHAETSARIWLR